MPTRALPPPPNQRLLGALAGWLSDRHVGRLCRSIESFMQPSGQMMHRKGNVQQKIRRQKWRTKIEVQSIGREWCLVFVEGLLRLHLLADCNCASGATVLVVGGFLGLLLGCCVSGVVGN